jgi:hypothetical protein
MFADFNVAGVVAFTRCGVAGDGCAVWACAAKADERRGLRRMAAAANNKEESAAMVRTDLRRKVPPEDFLSGIYLVPITATSYRWTSPFCAGASLAGENL